MSKYYLRIEGVNFDNFVLDTDKIKAIRGGSLMLLNSVEWLKRNLKGVRIITAGASWGMFSFEAENDHQAGEKMAEARRLFNKDEHYQHATMSFAVLPAGNEYQITRARLEALSRLEQMQSPSVAIPSIEGQSVSGVCEFDKVRPATRIVKLKRDDPEQERKGVSASVKARWHEDAKEKAYFYTKRTHLKRLEFVEDLHELAEDENFGNLNRKMAVIYLDGNHFGKKAAEYCTTEEKQKEFDARLRIKYQNGALKTLLEEVDKDRRWKNAGRIRLETLLWGGDEIIWVVPAWRGWWMLGRFFEITREWQMDGQQLTHGAGLVFCHYDAPIQPILRLARQLGDLAKGDRQSNRVAYQILESFDHTGADLETVRNQRWPLADKEAMILDGDAMRRADAGIGEIKQTDLPKRQLYRLAETAFSDRARAEKIAEALHSNGAGDQWSEVESCFGKGLPSWLHLLELWDYVGLENGGKWS